MYPIPIEQLIKAFTRFPSVGRRTAERFVFYLLKSGKKDAADLGNALQNLIKNIESCKECWDFSDTSPCAICTNPKRDQSTICVVAEPQDMRAIERTGNYHGLYHILRGTINPEAKQLAAGLKIAELMARVKQNQHTNNKALVEKSATVDASPVKPNLEVILALNPDLRGETTAMFLEKKLRSEIPELSISRLARGLPMGSDLQYADEITLSSALKYRTK